MSEFDQARNKEAPIPLPYPKEEATIYQNFLRPLKTMRVSARLAYTRLQALNGMVRSFCSTGWSLDNSVSLPTRGSMQTLDWLRGKRILDVGGGSAAEPSPFLPFPELYTNNIFGPDFGRYCAHVPDTQVFVLDIQRQAKGELFQEIRENATFHLDKLNRGHFDLINTQSFIGDYGGTTPELTNSYGDGENLKKIKKMIVRQALKLLSPGGIFCPHDTMDFVYQKTPDGIILWKESASTVTSDLLVPEYITESRIVE